MQTQRRWLGILLAVVLLLVALTTVAYAQEGTTGASPDAPAFFDADGDGIDDAIETATGTNPNDVDTDNDGLCDGNVFPLTDTNPTHTCTGPEDVNVDGRVQAGLETDPRKVDTDGDNLCDGPSASAADPVIAGAYWAPGCRSTLGPTRGGEDKNGNGVVDAAPETNPRLIDTDGDLLPDGWIDGWDFNKLTGAGAGLTGAPNGVRERWEGEDLNLNGVPDGVPAETDPRNPDTDGDTMRDWYEAHNLCLAPEADDRFQDGDGDGDPGPDGVFNTADDVIFLPNVREWQLRTDACNQDTDGDLITDDFEYAYSNSNPNNFCPDLNLDGVGDGVMNIGSDDGFRDYEPDAASNWTEFLGLNKTKPFVPFTLDPGDDSTSPCDWDTDGDRFIDGYEYWVRFDPDWDDLNGNGVQNPGESNMLCVGGEMSPVNNGDQFAAGPADYEPDNLLNGSEYQGEDGVSPSPNTIVALFPGDLITSRGLAGDTTRAKTWNADDPYFRFQPSGAASDATSACNIDTDRGGVSDRDEVAEVDINGDGLCTLWEENAGYDNSSCEAYWDFNGWDMDPNFETDDVLADHDYDGLGSLLEQQTVTDWLNPDTDYDALCDGSLAYVLQDPDNIYPNPLPAQVNLRTPPYQNPVVLLITNVLGGPKMFDLDSPNANFTIVDDYICGGGEDLSRNGLIAGDVDNDRMWDVDEDLDNDGVLDGNENDGLAGAPPADDGDGHLSIATELWTETDPDRADTDDDGLCDGSATNSFAPAGEPRGCVGGEDISAAGLDNAVDSERGVTETDPLDFDTDDDALSDLIEVVTMGARLDCQALGGGVFAALHADTDGDSLYDGFYDRNAAGLDVGAGVVGAGVQIGFIPWRGFDGPNNILNDDADVLVVNDLGDDDQPGEDVESLVQGAVQPLGDGVWNHTSGNVAVIFQETNACAADSEKDGIWDGTEYASYEAPEYNNPIPPNTNPWNSTRDLMDDTDIDMAPITMAAAKDWLRPALDVDSDGDRLCDGDVANAGNTGCRGPNDRLNDANGDWIDDDSINAALGAPNGIIWLIGEDITDPEGTQGGIQDPTETWPMAWDTDGDRVDDGIEVVWYERFDCGNRIYLNTVAAPTWACDGGNRNALDTDSDSDGLPDGWIDFDNDGVRDANEGEDFDLFARPALGDAFNGRILGDLNGDRIWDVNMDDGGVPGGLLGDPEVWEESDPLNFDTDGDHIWDGDEANAGIHDPGVCFSLWNADSDFDGLPDGWFDYGGTGPAVWKGEGVTRVPGTFAIDPTLNPARLDAIIAGDNGLGEGGVTYAAMAQDGIVDYHETWLETNPCNPDTDEDGNRDYVEVWGWEAGYLISEDGWQEGVPAGELVDGPKPMADSDRDGKLTAVDPNSDGKNLYPNPGIALPTGDYTYNGDSICDSGMSWNAVWRWYNGKDRMYQRIMPGGVVYDENNVNQTFREVCTLQSSTLIDGPFNPVVNADQWGEDIGWWVCNNQGCQLIGGDGLIGYGGFYAGNPIWNAFEAEDVWAPVWPYQNVLAATTSPLEWNLYFWQSPAAPTQTGFVRDNWDYPDAFVPIGSTQEYLAVGDWDRDRVIDDNEDGAYMVQGYDDIFGPGGNPAITEFKLVEDWGETDPLNADTDVDGVVDDKEVYSRYAGESQPRPGQCIDSTRWGPLTDDQDFDGALDGEEDVDGDGNYFSGLPLLNDIPWICDSDDPGTATCVPGYFAGTGTEARPNPNSTGVETGVCNADTDGDTLADGEELHVTLTDPADTDSNDNGVLDQNETPSACSIYDFNGDNVIDIVDISMVASRWMNPAQYNVRYDVAPAGAPDGVIDIADIAAVAVRFGETCTP